VDNNLNLNDFDYKLNKRYISEYPRGKRDESKLLIYQNDKIFNSNFLNLDSYIPDNSTIFLNNTRVINSRFYFINSNKNKIEILVIKTKNFKKSDINNVEIEGLIGNRNKWKNEEILTQTRKNIKLEALKKENKIFFRWNSKRSWDEILEIFGIIPLPPYIKRDVIDNDYNDYQTVYSKVNGSIASPTAGLHFSEKLIDKLKKSHLIENITLHVGIGTFKPIREKNIIDHKMHSESISITKQNILSIENSKNIIAVGTTSLRTLESIYYLAVKISSGESIDFIEQYPYQNDEKYFNRREVCKIILEFMKNSNIEKINFKSSLFIIPGYEFKLCDQLITNFHYPKSTLILLIAAFIGEDWRKVYNFALDNNYRFLSYGDSSLLYKK
tara:strand:+ start:16007 stop:17161 length:1155 start_codon:yes stop_codon:yes gene_type:complete